MSERSVLDKKRLAEFYTEYLQNEGYRPTVDNDGDVVFKREGATFMILIDEKDEEFFTVILPNFWQIDGESERIQVLKACDHVNKVVKAAKIYTVKDNVWTSVELFFRDRRGFQPVFERVLNSLRLAATTFAEQMKKGGEGEE